MKKDEFLKKLEKRLSILNEEERQDILDEYKGHIEKKIKAGMTEEEAVKDFGDFDTLVKDILSAYKINEDYSKSSSEKLENTFNIIVDEMVQFFQRLIQMFSNKKGEDLLRIICKIILVLFAIWLMRIPTWMIRELGESIFSVFPGILDHILSVGWAILIETFYVIFSILALYTLFKKMVFEEDEEIPEAKVEEIKKEPRKGRKKETTTELKEEPKRVVHTNTYLTPFLILAKIFVVIFTLPLLCTWVGLAIAIGVMIALFIKGVQLISVLLIILGLFMMTSSVIGIIYHFVWRGDK